MRSHPYYNLLTIHPLGMNSQADIESPLLTVFTMPQLSLSLLGPWQATLDGQPIDLKYDKVRALLAYLAVEADRPHRRETLMGMLWPDLPEAAARNNLRQVLLTLREAIGDRQREIPYLLASRAAVQFNAESDHWLDVKAITDLLAMCDRHPHRNPESCRSCARWRQQAADLYHGPFLAEFSLPDSTSFEEWTAVKREWLNQLIFAALSKLAAYHERRGQYDQALQATTRQLMLEPWREEAHRHAMRLHLLNGERSAALAQYESCRRLLAEELGVEPEAATTALYQQIRDASEDAPVAMQQLALPTTRPHTLPPQPTPFVGRETELAEIGRLLTETECRLLTLTGAGGMGKTRLALQAAAEHLDTFADGVFFVPLAALASADLLPGTIATALGIEATAADMTASLLNYLHQKEILLLLDNFEHLLADSQATGLLTSILADAPDVTLLVTSRERLNLRGEWLFQVNGFLDPGQGDNEAVQFFVQSARRVAPGFTLSPEVLPAVSHICQLVGGMPLAIELAAAWVRVLAPAEIAAEIERSSHFLTTTLRDVPSRHRSLDAVFDYSWQLLSPEEQSVLRKLALFRGGFRRKAAETVAGATLPLLTALVDKSLLQWNPAGRYELHELVRQYGLEKLEAAGETAETQTKHFAFFLELAETILPKLEGAELGRWLDQLQAEMDNFRAALSWAVEQGDEEDGVRLAGTLWWFWYTRGYLSEGREWLGRALSRAAAAPPGEAQAKARQGAGVLAWNQGDYEQARRHHEASLALMRSLGDQRAVSVELNNLGNVAMDQGDYEGAEMMLEESLAIKIALGDQFGQASTLNNLGLAAFGQGDFDAACSYYEQSLALKRSLEDTRGIAITLGNLGNTYLELGRFDRAYELLQESLALKQVLGDRWGVAVVLRQLGELSVRWGDYPAARDQLRESLLIRQQLDDKWSIADSLEAFATLAFAEEEPERAARLWGAAEALREAIGTALPGPDQRRHDHDVAAATAEWGEEVVRVAWDDGRTLSTDEAIAYALSQL